MILFFFETAQRNNQFFRVYFSLLVQIRLDYQSGWGSKVLLQTKMQLILYHYDREVFLTKIYPLESTLWVLSSVSLTSSTFSSFESYTFVSETGFVSETSSSFAPFGFLNGIGFAISTLISLNVAVVHGCVILTLPSFKRKEKEKIFFCLFPSTDIRLNILEIKLSVLLTSLESDNFHHRQDQSLILIKNQLQRIHLPKLQKQDEDQCRLTN